MLSLRIHQVLQVIQPLGVFFEAGLRLVVLLPTERVVRVPLGEVYMLLPGSNDEFLREVSCHRVPLAASRAGSSCLESGAYLLSSLSGSARFQTHLFRLR